MSCEAAAPRGGPEAPGRYLRNREPSQALNARPTVSPPRGQTRAPPDPWITAPLTCRPPAPPAGPQYGAVPCRKTGEATPLSRSPPGAPGTAAAAGCSPSPALSPGASGRGLSSRGGGGGGRCASRWLRGERAGEEDGGGARGAGGRTVPWAGGHRYRRRHRHRQGYRRRLAGARWARAGWGGVGWAPQGAAVGQRGKVGVGGSRAGREVKAGDGV